MDGWMDAINLPVVWKKGQSISAIGLYFCLLAGWLQLLLAVALVRCPPHNIVLLRWIFQPFQWCDNVYSIIINAWWKVAEYLFFFPFCKSQMSEKQQYFGASSSSSQSNSNTLSRPVRRHLVNVYLTLAAMCAIATAGTQVGDYLGAAGSPIGTLGAFTSVSMFRYTAPRSRNRWALLAVSKRCNG